MGSLSNESVLIAGAADTGGPIRRKTRFLSLHGFRTSADIMRTQVVGKWPKSPPGWTSSSSTRPTRPRASPTSKEYSLRPTTNGFSSKRNFDECLEYIEELMIKYAPVDGLMGFSQGAILSGALPGLQAKGIALTKVPKIKYLIIIGGGKFRSPAVAGKAYANKNECTSLHFLGDTDFLKETGEALLESFLNPFVIRHPKGHTVPRIDEKSLVTMLEFLQKIESDICQDANIDSEKSV